jgi:hypothetical protein
MISSNPVKGSSTGKYGGVKRGRAAALFPPRLRPVRTPVAGWAAWTSETSQVDAAEWRAANSLGP